MNQKPGLILVVDDEADLRSVICEELEHAGYQTLQAGDGRQALELTLAHRPHVLLSDIQMPNKNGFELIGDLRAKGVEMPCVLFTAYTDKDKLMQAIRLGVVDFLEKPFDMSVLLEITERAVLLGLEMRRLEDELEIQQQAQSLSEHSKLGSTTHSSQSTEARTQVRRARLAQLILWNGVESPRKKAG